MPMVWTFEAFLCACFSLGTRKNGSFCPRTSTATTLSVAHLATSTTISSVVTVSIAWSTAAQVIPNLDGSLCAHYPPGIIVPQGSTGQPTSADTTDLHGMFFDARFARTRSRFVCPVILHRGKVRPCTGGVPRHHVC